MGLGAFIRGLKKLSSLFYVAIKLTKTMECYLENLSFQPLICQFAAFNQGEDIKGLIDQEFQDKTAKSILNSIFLVAKCSVQQKF
jgi:hypothetical protein